MYKKKKKSSKGCKMRNRAVGALCEAKSFDVTKNGNGAKLVSQCWADYILKDCSEIDRLQNFAGWQRYIQGNFDALVKATEEKTKCKVNRTMPPGKNRLEKICIGSVYEGTDADLEHITSKGRRVEAINRSYGRDIKSRKPEMLMECSHRVARLLLGGAEAEVKVTE